MSKNLTVRLSVASNGGALVLAKFCEANAPDIADVLQEQGVALDNQKVFLNGEPCELTDKVKDRDLITVAKINSKSGRA